MLYGIKNFGTRSEQREFQQQLFLSRVGRYETLQKLWAFLEEREAGSSHAWRKVYEVALVFWKSLQTAKLAQPIRSFGNERLNMRQLIKETKKNFFELLDIQSDDPEAIEAFAVLYAAADSRFDAGFYKSVARI